MCPTYPAEQLKTHEAAHKMFVDKVESFEKNFGDGNLGSVYELVTGEMVTFLVEWLTNHIQNTDMKCAEYFNFAENRDKDFRLKLKEIGCDATVLSTKLLEHFKTAKEINFTQFSLEKFSVLLSAVVPECAGSAGEIFKVIDTDSSGDIDLQEIFTVLISGPLLDGKYKYVRWTTQEFGCAHATIDEDHQELFDLINYIIDAVKIQNVDRIQVAIAGLRRYTVFHFRREIEMLKMVPTCPVDALAKHVASHKHFVDKVESFEKGFVEGNLASVVELATGEILSFMVDWLS